MFFWRGGGGRGGQGALWSMWKYMLANFLILSNTLLFKQFFCFMCALRKNTRILPKNSTKWRQVSSLCQSSYARQVGFWNLLPEAGKRSPISISLWLLQDCLLSRGETSHFKWKSFAETYDETLTERRATNVRVSLTDFLIAIQGHQLEAPKIYM